MNSNRPSATAKLIAAATVMRDESLGRGGAAPAGAAEWSRRFLSTSRADRLLLWSACSALGQAWWRLVESFYLPGVVSHWMRRKREIDRLARQAAMEGFQQLIVLGAGLDTLAFRLNHERLYECILSADHPATLAVVDSATGLLKAPAESLLHDGMPHRVELLALDFARDDVCQVLASSPKFDAKRATFVVIEGVLMYLSEPTVVRVLRSLAALPTPILRLIASSMIAEPGQVVGFRGQSGLVTSWLRRRNEPMLWASSRSALPALLVELGWSSARLIDLTDDDTTGGITAGGLRSEMLVVAERFAAR